MLNSYNAVEMAFKELLYEPSEQHILDCIRAVESSTLNKDDERLLVREVMNDYERDQL